MVESVSRLMLRAAAIDVAACVALDAAPGMPDSVIGFHPQQACEKCLKAVLAATNLEFPRTHDLLRLIHLLAAKGVALPSEANWIDELTPYAVSARYGLIEVDATLDRRRTFATIIELWEWARQHCGHDGDA